MAYALELLIAFVLCAFSAQCAWADTPFLTNQWSFPTQGTGDGSPAIGPDGTIYCGTWLGQLLAVNSNGSRKWLFQAGREIWSSPAVGSDGTVYVGCRDHYCYAVGPEGKLRWRFKTGGWVDCSPGLGADGTIYFGSWDTNFYAVRPSGGKAWQFPTGGPIVSSPAIGTDGRMYFGSHDAKFYALQPDGTKAWEFATGGPIISSPALDQDGTIYFTSTDGLFYALTTQGGLKWHIRTGGITGSSPVLGGDGTIYVGVNQKLWALSPAGTKLWERWDPAHQTLEASPTALADGTVLVVATYGLTDFDGASTPARWYYQLVNQGPSCPAVGSNGTLYVLGLCANFSSALAALPTAAPLARSAWPKFRGNPQNTGRVGFTKP